MKWTALAPYKAQNKAQNASLFMFVSPCSFHVFKLSRSETEVGLGDPEYDAQDESYEARDGNGRP